MITTIILISLGLAALIAASVGVGMWFQGDYVALFGHEEPPARKDSDEHEDVEEVWG